MTSSKLSVSLCLRVPVTAKMRLGYLDSDLALENARAIEAAGASGLAVHARTKLQGYRPPAHWHELDAIQEALSIPVTANGDIFAVEDAHRYRSESGCSDIMIGRGILRDPDLPSAIVASMGNNCPDRQWERCLDILQRFTNKVLHTPEHPDQEHPYYINNPRRYLDGRLKQWLSMMSKSSKRAQQLFDRIKTETSVSGISQIMQEAQ